MVRDQKQVQVLDTELQGFGRLLLLCRETPVAQCSTHLASSFSVPQRCQLSDLLVLSHLRWNNRS